MTSYAAQLRRIPGLERWSRNRIGELARASERIDVPAGASVIAPDDRWSGAVLLESGHAIARIGGWEFDLPRGARIIRTEANPIPLSVVAESDVRILAVDRRNRDALREP